MRPYELEKDSGGVIPVSQIENDAGTGSMPWKGSDNAGYVKVISLPDAFDPPIETILNAQNEALDANVALVATDNALHVKAIDVTLDDNNAEQQVMMEGPRTMDGSGGTVDNPDYKYATFIINISAIEGTQTINIAIWAVTANGYEYKIIETGALDTVGTYIMKIGPGLPTTANESINIPLPKGWKYRSTLGSTGGDSITVGMDAFFSR